MNLPLRLLPVALCLLTAFLFVECHSDNEIVFYCDEDNDLYQLLRSAGKDCQNYSDIPQALRQCEPNGVLLILAKDYPSKKTILPESFYDVVEEKNLRVYVEFPDRLASATTGDIRSTRKERLVVSSDFFGSKAPPMTILDAGLFAYVDVPDRTSHLRGGNVAGFDKAVYSFEGIDDFPVLFEENNVLVSTTKLSDFNKSRYAPIHGWKNAISGILSFLAIDLDSTKLAWDPIVKPAYAKDEELREDAYPLAVKRGVEWYFKGRFLIHPEWKAQWQKIDTLALPVGPPMDLTLPSGDGLLGVMEGHYSYINPDGSQPYRYWLRADCTAEAAMAIAMGSDSSNAKNLNVSENLLDLIFNTDAFKTPTSKDPDMTSYGLTGWANTRKARYYGDDNARVLLGAIMASQRLETNKWDRQIVELILANFRTSGEKGFRGNALTGDKLDETTWQQLMKGQLENTAPHYESWLWATYLWLYDKTKYPALLEKAKKAISITMQAYPDKWKWANGIQQERARMILPLAWLVRVEDTEEHRSWLNRVCNDLLRNQVASGAIREELGSNDKGKYGAPASNDKYGTNEAPVIHTNGDPVADMLYTSNFAFFSLNEAAQATGDAKLKDAVRRLGDFLVRIQSTSAGRADLDGCWFRAFDYDHWEFYGSNADHGWGAWGTITGWTQSFIVTTLALTHDETSYWDTTKGTSIGSAMEDSWSLMLPGVAH